MRQRPEEPTHIGTMSLPALEAMFYLSWKKVTLSVEAAENGDRAGVYRVSLMHHTRQWLRGSEQSHVYFHFDSSADEVSVDSNARYLHIFEEVAREGVCGPGRNEIRLDVRRSEVTVVSFYLKAKQQQVVVTKAPWGEAFQVMM